MKRSRILGAGRRFTALALCFTAAAIMVMAGTQGEAQAVKRGGTLTVGVETDFRGFDPPAAGVIEETPALAMFDSLFTLDPDTQQSIPTLGLSMKSGPKGMSWTVNLRKGVKFHDGTDFNAEVVAFNYNRLLKSACRCRAFISTVTSVEATGKYTVKFNLKHPWGAFRAAITGPAIFTYIHSPAAIKKYGKDYNRNPVGTGPFKLEKWISGDRLVLVRNQNYWKKGTPYLDKVIIRPIPDTEARYASILTKDVDVIWTDRANHIIKAGKDKRIILRKGESPGALTTFLNHSKPPLDDPRVRKALQLAYDTALYVKATRKGVTPTTYSPYGPKFEKSCDVQYPRPNIAKAKQLIKEYGKPVKVTYQHTTTARGREGAQIAQQMWKKIGVETVMNPVDQTTLIRNVVTGNYMISGWRMIPEPDPFLDIQTVGTFYSKSPANYEKYNNPAMDKLVLGGRMTSDPKKRAQIYCQIARLIAKDVPLLYRGGFSSYLIQLPDVKNMPNPFYKTIDVAKIWLDR